MSELSSTTPSGNGPAPGQLQLQSETPSSNSQNPQNPQNPSDSSQQPRNEQQPVKMIGMKELPGWIAKNVSDKQKGLGGKIIPQPLFIRPNTLRSLYVLFYYEYIKYSLAIQGNVQKKQMPNPSTDNDIKIPERNLLVLLGIFFDTSSFDYFNTLSTT